jgi:hypothetical protein
MELHVRLLQLEIVCHKQFPDELRSWAEVVAEASDVVKAGWPDIWAGHQGRSETRHTQSRCFIEMACYQCSSHLYTCICICIYIDTSMYISMYYSARTPGQPRHTTRTHGQTQPHQPKKHC